MTAPWLLVAGDLTPLGGMDAANHALARYLGARESEVHLVTHRAWADLVDFPSVTVHRVWRPFNRHLLGGPLLARAGSRLWRIVNARGGRTVVNGGNCLVAAANWVHYLHAAYQPRVAGSAGRRVRHAMTHRHDLETERKALQAARVVICNSQRTRRDVIDRLDIAEDRVRVVYYGSDAARFSVVSESERVTAKRALAGTTDRPLVGFVGALGDRRKAFDTLFIAWQSLCAKPGWDANLIVVGTGSELATWQQRTRDAGLADRIRFLGFREDVPNVLAALDALVHPARYEAYGLSVHEALCRGVAALVSRSAGVAEHYPASLQDLLINDPDNPQELEERLTHWRASVDGWRTLAGPVGKLLRDRGWDAMAAQIVECVERAA